LQEKIVLVTPSFCTPRGNSTTARRLAEGYQRTNYRVEVVSLEDEAWPRQWQKACGVDYAGRCLYHILHAKSLQALLEAGLLAMDALPLVILTMTGTDIDDLRRARQMAWVVWLDKVGAVAVFDREHRDFLLSLFPHLGDRLCLVPQGVALPAQVAYQEHPLWDKMGEDCFLLPAGIRPVKDIALAIEAFAELEQNQARGRLLVVGPVLDELYYQEICQMARQVSNVHLLPSVPYPEIFQLYRRAVAVLNTSRHEGQPQAVMEAMTLGIPPLLRRVPGNIGIAEDGISGYYFADAQELAERVVYSLKHPDELRQMGKAAVAHALSQWAPETELSSYLRIIQQLLFNAEI
jgi:glycosyltransferase involved in cell wall biosynthesis